jgi:hypothetical protein
MAGRVGTVETGDSGDDSDSGDGRNSGGGGNSGWGLTIAHVVDVHARKLPADCPQCASCAAPSPQSHVSTRRRRGWPREERALGAYLPQVLDLLLIVIVVLVSEGDFWGDLLAQVDLRCVLPRGGGLRQPPQHVVDSHAPVGAVVLINREPLLALADHLESVVLLRGVVASFSGPPVVWLFARHGRLGPEPIHEFAIRGTLGLRLLLGFQACLSFLPPPPLYARTWRHSCTHRGEQETCATNDYHVQLPCTVPELQHRIQHFPKFGPLFEWKVSSRSICALYSTERPRITTIQLMLDFAACV